MSIRHAARCWSTLASVMRVTFTASELAKLWAHSCYYLTGVQVPFFFFSTRAQLSSSAFITLSLRLVGGKRTMDTTSPLLTSNTLLQSWTWCIIFNIIKERKIYWKMYPSECGRGLKYVTCKGKNWCSIIPKRDAEKCTSTLMWLSEDQIDPHCKICALYRKPQ